MAHPYKDAGRSARKVDRLIQGYASSAKDADAKQDKALVKRALADRDSDMHGKPGRFARGGRTKNGKTNIAINIVPGAGAGAPPANLGALGAPPPMAPPAPMAPPPGGPVGGPPGMAPPPGMMRKDGGRTGYKRGGAVRKRDLGGRLPEPITNLASSLGAQRSAMPGVGVPGKIAPPGMAQPNAGAAAAMGPHMPGEAAAAQQRAAALGAAAQQQKAALEANGYQRPMPGGGTPGIVPNTMLPPTGGMAMSAPDAPLGMSPPLGRPNAPMNRGGRTARKTGGRLTSENTKQVTMSHAAGGGLGRLEKTSKQRKVYP